jgi:hypothetical protein
MGDDMIISRGLESLRDSLVSDMARGVTPEPKTYLPSLERHCLRLLFSDDTGPGESDFPGARSLCRAIRRAGHACHWVWWKRSPCYVFSLPNRGYRIHPSEEGPPAAVDLREAPTVSCPVEVTVRPDDFVNLVGHFDGEIIPRLPEALAGYIFFLEKEFMARRIQQVAAAAVKSPCTERP